MELRYQELKTTLSRLIPEERLIDDPLRCLAYGSDASFYRLIPALVVRVVNEGDVVFLLQQAHQHNTPVTFRAAGTSLSGQAVTDGVLAVLEGDSWHSHKVLNNGKAIRLQPGIIGEQANRYLAPHGRKIGPDPASLSSCKIGGIAANNASGMCCGIDQNSYKTLQSMRIILADGTLLDTASPFSRSRFAERNRRMVEGLNRLRHETLSNPALSARIRDKYRIKNTTGYSLNALIDYDDPLEILQHLMIGSEGTLGFIAEITYKTVAEHSHKATALLLFSNVQSACDALPLLKQTSVDAVELMDRAALASVQQQPGIDGLLGTLGPATTALLIESRADTPHQLQQQIGQIKTALAPLPTENGVHFSDQPETCQQLWKIRKGLFPSVGAVRDPGTTVVIEDIAFPLGRLAAGTTALQTLLQQHGYHNAILFGHALEGNLHFVITPNFNQPEAIHQYHRFMDELSHTIVEQFNGSLKAEHGTGRNMAPYVELEWGADAYRLMQEIKQLFDPRNLLNPGVILNSDANIHIKHLKPMAAVDPLVDRCIECGFCEPICPSRNLTLTPRQRIVAMREQQQSREPFNTPDYAWLVTDSCATDGLCATRCPVGIDTGAMVLNLRSQQPTKTTDTSRQIEHSARSTRWKLGVAHRMNQWLGPAIVEKTSQKLTRLSKGKLPSWDRWTPRPATPLLPSITPDSDTRPKVVYFSACNNHIFGSASSDEAQDLHTTIQSLLDKAGYTMVLPAEHTAHCCGLPFQSQGEIKAATESSQHLEQTLWETSQQGTLPILCDSSPCTARMVEQFQQPMELLEPVPFALHYLLPKLQRHTQLEQIALHIPCSARKRGLTAEFETLAHHCAKQIFQPEEEGCCGFAGDKGFTTPTLNAAALSHLRKQLPENVEQGCSSSRTCEIGLSRHSGIHYRSILHLVDHCFDAKTTTPQNRKE